MGLSLPNPLIVSASPLTANIKGVKKAFKAGAGAVVLTSLFEEDIAGANSSVEIDYNIHPEALDYVERMNMLLEPDRYLEFVEESVNSVDIPVIASLNCYSPRWWVDYTERIAGVGADGIELNLSPIALDSGTDAKSIEDRLINMVSLARETVSIPLAVKIGPGFTALPHLANALKEAGANALTLFNRFYRMDIDIEKLEFKSGNSLSSAEEFGTVLRWIGILSDTSGIELSASTGIYDEEGAVKVLLAGGQTIQICSAIYRHKSGVLRKILNGLMGWMESHNFNSLDDFRGRLSFKGDEMEDYYHRLQYVKALKNTV